MASSAQSTTYAGQGAGRRWLLPLVLVCVAAALWPALRGAFVYDDLWLVGQNPGVRSFSGLVDSWRGPYWDFVRPVGQDSTAYWRPMTTAALFFANAIGGGTPFGFHALSLALHLGATALAFALARRLSRSEIVAFGTALLFGLQPVQVESVAWISAVNDPLAGVFVLGCANAFVAWREGGSRGVPWSAGAFTLLGLLSKESAGVAVLLCLAIDLLSGRSSARPFVRGYAPLAAACVLYLAARMAVFGNAFGGLDLPTGHLMLDAGRKLSLRVEMAGSFVGLLFWPSTLNLFRDARPVIPQWDPELVRAAIWIGAWAAALALAGWRRWRLVCVGLVWIAIAISPLLVAVQSLGRCPISERFLYVAVFGAALVVASALAALRPPALGWIAIVALGALAGVRSRARTAVWTDERTLFTESALASPKSPYVLWGLGRVLLEEYRRTHAIDSLNGALKAFQRSQSLGAVPKEGEPRDESVLVTVEDRLQANLGVGWCFLLCEANLGDECSPGEAEGVFKEVVRVQPDSADAHVGLGTALGQRGDWAGAAAELTRATELNPRSRDAWFNLGLAEARRGSFEAALSAFDKARAIDPRDVDTLIELASVLGDSGGGDRALGLLEEVRAIDPRNLRAMLLSGVVLAKAQRYEEALAWLDRALAVDPAFGPAHLERAKILFQLGRPDRAVGSFDRACQLMPGSFEAHYLYGGLLANSGDKRNALPFLERALKLQPDGPMAESLRQTIESLRAEVPAGR